MTPEPEPPSLLDTEAMKELKFRLDGEEEWRVLSETELLAAFREATIPSSTLFRRGDDGPARTLASLVSWNGRECPFADFSHPDSRRGANRAPAAGSTDEKHTCARGAGGDAGGGGEEGQGVVFSRFVAYMDQIGERMTSIEKLLTEQQSRLGGAEIFMKKVAVLEVRIRQCEQAVKAHDHHVSTMHRLFYALKPPGDDRFMLPGADLAALLEATQQAQADCAEKCKDLSMYKEEVAALSSIGNECSKRLENLDDRYAQLLQLLSAHERNVDVREALEEWNLKQRETAERRAQAQKEEEREKEQEERENKELLALRSPRPVPLPRRANALPSVAAVSLLDLPVIRDAAAREQQQQMLEGRVRACIPNTVAGVRLKGLLLGRKPEERDAGDVPASPASTLHLFNLGSDLHKTGRGALGKLTELMHNPNFECICGAKPQSGQNVIMHFSATKHTNYRAHPVYQRDVDYWTDIVQNLIRGFAPNAR